MSWFKRKTRTADPEETKPSDPANTINLMTRLDSVVDRLNGVSEQLIETLEQAQQNPVKGSGNGG